ncbi:hypothetical protein PQX77_006302 [Marasmius sp. AFHP31]|nr:hypothetical protein PQX77_006302 [Marasmius sp. AFHP31]
MNSYNYRNSNNNNNSYPQQQQQHPNTIPMYPSLTGYDSHPTMVSPTHSEDLALSPLTLSPPAPHPSTTFYEPFESYHHLPVQAYPVPHDAAYPGYAGVSADAAIPADTRYLQPSPVNTSFNEAPRAGPSRRQTTRRVDPHPYSSTSRRRPSSHLQIQSSEDEELEELPPNATEKEKLRYQRHRNTLAARRSRKKKEIYKQELEQMVDQLTMETEKWKTRAEMLRRMLESQGMGLACPDWSE